MVIPRFDDMPVNFGVRSAFTKGGSELIDAIGYNQLKETARVMGTYVSRKLIVVGSEDATAFATGEALLGELAKLGVKVGTDDPRTYASGISSFSNDNHVAVEDSAQRSGLWTPGVEQLVVVGSAPLFNGYFS